MKKKPLSEDEMAALGKNMRNLVDTDPRLTERERQALRKCFNDFDHHGQKMVLPKDIRSEAAMNAYHMGVVARAFEDFQLKKYFPQQWAAQQRQRRKDKSK